MDKKFMKSCVFCIISKKPEVFNAVVIRNIIYMMNYLFRFKIPPKIFLHNKTVFAHISTAIKGMFGLINNNMAGCHFSDSSFPIRMVFATKFRKLFSFFKGNYASSAFSITFIRTIFPFTSLEISRNCPKFFPTNQTFFNYFGRITFLRTIFTITIFYPRWTCIKFFTALNTLNHFIFFYFFIYSSWHFVSSKIKAAFGGLKEAVKLLHLLTAKLADIKIPLPSSSLSIAYFFSLSTKEVSFA